MNIANCQFCAEPLLTPDRLPRGWKRDGQGLPVCGTCWRTQYVLRAVTFPVASPLDIDWPTLRCKLDAAWQASTRAHNLLLTALAKADIIRDPSMSKLPVAPKLYLYPIIRAACPEVDSGTASAIAQQVQRKYNARRLDVVWRGAASLPMYRYPTPYPLRAQDWSAEYLSATERVPVVSIRLGGERTRLRLRGGHEFRRQLGAFSQLCAGTAVPAEAALYRVTAQSADHRSGASDRVHGAKQSFRIMCKLAMWLPRRALNNQGEQRVMRVATSPNSFWQGELDGRSTAWNLHADHVQRWIMGYGSQMKRLADDSKFEKRWPKRVREGIAHRRETLMGTHHRRIASFIHEASAMLTTFCCRNRVNVLLYDDSARDFLPSFPWADLRGKLLYKLEEHGIEFRASGSVVTSNTEPLVEA